MHAQKPIKINSHPLPAVFLSPAMMLSISILMSAIVGLLIWAQMKTGFRFVFDWWDLSVYFSSSRWMTEGGRLYVSVQSEYPLLANLFFALFRCLASIIGPGEKTFYIVWVTAAFIVYLALVYAVARETSALALFAWVTPAALYFALLRYDLFPVAATLLAMFAIRRGAYYAGALWLGAAIALKGYALFLLPAYCAFIISRRGVSSSIKASVLAVSPMALCLLATFAYAGSEGLTAAFKFHAQRLQNGESTYDAINYFFATAQIPKEPWVRPISQLLQIACALLAAAMRPQTFDQLVKAFSFALLGFISFSIFHSPQYILWVLPIVCFSESRMMLLLAIMYGWITYFYFPIACFLSEALPRMFHTSIISVTMVRFAMMFLAVSDHFSSTEEKRLAGVQAQL